MAQAPDLIERIPFDPEVLEAPWEYNRALREHAPVRRDPTTGLFMISTYEAVSEALRNWEVFSNRFGLALGGGTSQEPPAEVMEVMRDGFMPVDTMLTADPPEQRRYRKLSNRAFLPKRVDALEPRMEQICRERLDDFGPKGQVELVSEFTVPLPLTIISEQLGVATEDLPSFRRWTDGFVAQLGLMADTEGQIEAAKLIREFQDYFVLRLEERRAEPKNDILSDLVNARFEGERPLDVGECLSILQQILVAGNETTASAIAEGVMLLLQNPEQLAKVREDPDRIPNLVEEVLRLSTPTANMWRYVKQDTELCGVEIPEGSMALVRYSSANRDEKVFPDPDRFDIERANAEDHLAFGLGVHFCLGAVLARREMNVAFRTFLERMPDDLRFTPDRNDFRHKPNVLLRGLEELHLSFSPC